MKINFASVLLPGMVLMAYGPWQATFPPTLWILAFLCFTGDVSLAWADKALSHKER